MKHGLHLPDETGASDPTRSFVREGGAWRGLPAAASTMVAVLMGAIGGFAGLVLGYLLVTFAFAIGRSGYTGAEYLGFSNPDVAWLLAKAGGVPLGAIVTPIIYFRYLRHAVLDHKWFSLPLVTLLGGMAGAFAGGPPGAAMGGIGAFGACAIWIRTLTES